VFPPRPRGKKKEGPSPNQIKGGIYKRQRNQTSLFSFLRKRGETSWANFSKHKEEGGNSKGSNTLKTPKRERRGRKKAFIYLAGGGGGNTDSKKGKKGKKGLIRGKETMYSVLYRKEGGGRGPVQYRWLDSSKEGG